MDDDQNDFNDALQDAIAVLAENMGPEHQSMLRAFFSPEVQTCLKVVQEVAGFEMASNLREPFLEFHRYVTDPQPDFITRLRNDDKKGDYWYHQLVNGILGNVQQSFTCVLYHQSRLLTVEAELMTRLASLGEMPGILKNSTMGVGGTQILDFEYQAYVMAYRRCLDQFATAVSAFFKDRTNSFRKLSKNLSLKRPSGVVEAIANVHKKHMAAFEFVMSEGGDPSVRDRIAHFEFVPAGTLNLRPDGAILLGGGEDLNFFESGGNEKSMLANVITSKTIALHNCIAELISEFIRAVTAWECDSIAT
ncbi:hypothetical protein [Pseudomonas syringae]|uniref:hypothetical protein n=1 Tax=Pseudomonas syringae TaxID=317 RepID=UPI00200ADF2E|nr:hypothetical protein [Pseudomonas syringae]MCK9739514.1 hypothetical protein [Pseudomonas syringae pv. syringae]MDU8619011.1 hypothetical protein [Pseudomonas syringae]